MVACGMIVALMASLGSKFNASATLFTMDFYREWYPNASGKTEVIVGRIATAAIVFIGICWVLVIKSLHMPIFMCICKTCRAISRPPSRCCSGWACSGNAPPPRPPCGPSSIGMVGGFARLAADLVMRNDADAVAKLKGSISTTDVITLDQYNAGIAAIRAKHNGLMFDFWNIHWLYYCEDLFVLTAVLDGRHQPHDQGAGSEDHQIHLVWRHAGGKGRHQSQLECHGRRVSA